jgi:hypothetical protein
MDDQTPRQPQVQPVPEQLLPTPIVPEAQSQPMLEVEPATSTPTFLPAPTPLGGEGVFIPPFTQPVASKKSKKRFLIILAAILIILIGGGVGVYAFWYQNPEKVVTDGVLHALQAKSIEYTGSFSTDIASNKSKVEITGADVSDAHKVSVKMTTSDPFTGKEVPIEGEGIFDAKSDLYVKVKNVDDVVAPYRNFFSKTTQQSFDKIVAKVNDKWVKISATDLAGLGQETSKTQTCMAEVIKKYANDSSVISEFTETYKKNRFIIVDQNLGTKDGSLGYTMKTDEAKAKSFIEGVKATKAYAALRECDNNFNITSNDITLAPDTKTQTARAEIWVSQWTHQITKLSTSLTFPVEEDSSTGKVDALFEPKFNTGVTISTPEASTTLAELKTDIEKLFKDAEAEYMVSSQSKV